MSVDAPLSATFDLRDAEATAAAGAALGLRLSPGDAVLLTGPIGAGKSHLARAAIAARLQAEGEAPEDIPSPTFTLVQTYRAGALDLWHAVAQGPARWADTLALMQEAADGQDG